MSTLKEIQEKFQKSILQQDETIIDDIVDTSKEERAVLLNVYQHAYGARLIEFLENDFPKTFAYMGDENFNHIAKDYYETHPSDNPNARWFGRFFPEFLAKHPELVNNPECGELAHLEYALGTAFDAPDTKPLTKTDFAQLSPEDWPTLKFKAHPSTSRLSLKTNASEIWSSLHKEEELVESKSKALIIELISWRGDNMARFRTMSYDEAMIWDEALKGANFGQICEMLGTYWPSEEAPLKAAGYLQAWIASEFLIDPA